MTKYNDPFSTLTSFFFDFEVHYDGLEMDRVRVLVDHLKAKILEVNPNEQIDPMLTHSTMMDFLMRFEEQFTIADFSKCVKIPSKLHWDLNSAIFGIQSEDEVENKQNEFQQLQQELAHIKAQVNSQNQTNDMNTSSNSQTNNANKEKQVTFDFSSSTNASNSISNFDLSGALAKMSRGIDALVLNSAAPAVVPPPKKERLKVATSPPKFDPKLHDNLRQYARKDFMYWARDEGLMKEEATMFLHRAFSRKIHRDHVDKIAVDKISGLPNFTNASELMEKIIHDLRFDHETLEQLKNRFRLFQASNKYRLDDEFLRCFNLRDLGWPSEAENDQIHETKKIFLRGVRSHPLYNLIFTISKTVDWTNAFDYFEVAAQLREIQVSHTKTTGASTQSPTNTATHPTEMMDTSNNMQFQDLSMYAEQDQFYDVPAIIQNHQVQPTVNNASKICRNNKCKKPFSPENVKHYCCSTECVDAYKKDRFGADYKEKFRKKRDDKKPRTANNMPLPPPTSNGAESSSNVSRDLREFFITPCHIYLTDCNIPNVIHNSLFDSGASLTMITKQQMIDLNVQHLLKRDPNQGILGGDSRPMTGYCGSVKLTMKLEDTESRLTKKFSLEVLVFDNLNHPFIVGQDSMRKGMFQFTCYPNLKAILIDPSFRLMRKYKKMESQKIKALNNLCESEPAVSSINKDSEQVFEPEIIQVESRSSQSPNSTTDDGSSSPQKFNDYSNPNLVLPSFSDFSNSNEQFILNVPGTKTNNAYKEMFSDKVEELTQGFMNNLQAFYGKSLGDTLTTGGLDGLLDENKVQFRNTKIIETKKGPVQVGEQLSDKMTKRVKDLFDNLKSNVFDTTTLGCTTESCEPEINPDTKSSPQAPRYMPLNPFMRDEARKLVQNMVDLGVLEKCNDPANSSIFIVQKPNGKWRLIADLRRYNKEIMDFVVHLPSPYELINQICQFDMYSYSDFKDAFFQVPFSEKTLKEHPVVASVCGQATNYKFLRMAQGLKTATAVFIGILNRVYAKISDWIINYLDDAVIGSSDDEEEHFNRVVEFIKITDEAGLRISLQKSVWFATNISFLNYSISRGTWSISENQRKTINALNSDNLTKSKRESLSAFVNHFNRFHTGVSNAARRIRDPNTTPDSVKSILDNIKANLVQASALQAVNFTDTLHIYTDASQFDCSGVILQKSKNGGFRLVTCFSKKFPTAMVNKPIHQRELWSVQQISLTYKFLFIGSHQKIFHIDSRIVLAAQYSKAPSLRCLFDTIKSTFSNVLFKFVPSNKNASDAFTRVNNAVNNIQFAINAITRPRRNCGKPKYFGVAQPSRETLNPTAAPDTHFDMGNSESQNVNVVPDTVLTPEITVPVDSGETILNTTPDTSPTQTTVSDIETIPKCKQLPENIQLKILKAHVNGGCREPSRILLTLKGLGHDLKLQDIVDVLKNCELCANIKNFVKPRKSAPGITNPKELTCNDCIYIDFKQILNKHRVKVIKSRTTEDPDFEPPVPDCKSILTVFEPVSSLVYAVPVKNYQTDSVKSSLRILFMICGPVKNVVSDNAPEFKALAQWLKEEFDCDLHHTSVFHPNSNLSERAHREFEKILKVHDSDKDEFNFENWEDTIMRACISLNSLRHRVHNVSPFEVFRNRIQADIEPTQFHPVGMERRLVNENFAEKVERIMKSKLKLVLPVFTKGQQVKVKFPDEKEARYGTVTSERDFRFKHSTHVRFNGQPPVAVNKDYICVQKFTPRTQL